LTENNQHKGSSVDVNAFEKIFREYFSPLVYFAVRFVKDVDSAREIVHQVFVRIWENREEIHLDSAMRSYLFTAVRNRCLNHLRDQAKFHPDDVSNIPEIETSTEETGNPAESDELESAINSAVNTLPEKCREIFRMNRFGGLKYREIAENLDISVKTVEAQMSKALKLIREKLVDYFDIIILWILLKFF
jgi:RNA polymerase sigma-70 factor (ECF subfamily)